MDETLKQNYELAEVDYLSNMKYKDIAEKYGVSLNTVKSWKTRHGWSKDKNKGMHTKIKVCTQNKRDAEKREIAILNDSLTEKQRLFCLYYVKYRNKVKAYQKAYQCSYENACGNATALWKNIEVQNEVNRIMDDIREDIKVDIVDLIQQQIDIARADITDFVEIGRGMISPKQEIDGTLIKEIRDTPTGISIKLYDKQKAIEYLTDHVDSKGNSSIDNMQSLAEILLNAKPNRNLENFE